MTETIKDIPLDEIHPFPDHHSECVTMMPCTSQETFAKNPFFLLCVNGVHAFRKPNYFSIVVQHNIFSIDL